METNYQHYSITDFASDDFFIRHQLNPTDSSTQYWNNWLTAHPAKNAEWTEAKKLIEAVLHGLTEYTRTYLSEEAEAQLLKRIISSNQSADLPQRPIWKLTSWHYVAASLILVSVLSAVWFLKNDSPKTRYQNQIAELQESVDEKVNTSSSPQTFYLPDSSEVTLYPDSRLSFTSGFNSENRTVYLSGKALFDVVKNPAKPFFVFANETITKVLGTQFEVSAFDKDLDVIVTVKSGQVTVYQNQNSSSTEEPTHKGVLLHPNQQVVYKRDSEQFNKMLSNNPQLLSPPNRQPTFIYDETDLSSVFQELENAYGVDIIYNKEVLGKCQLTANLSEEPLKEKLDIICKSVGAQSEIIDAQIVISSKGCAP